MFTCRAQRGKSRWPVVKKWGQVSLTVEDFPRGEGVLEQLRHGGHDGDALHARKSRRHAELEASSPPALAVVTF